VSSRWEREGKKRQPDACGPSKLPRVDSIALDSLTIVDTHEGRLSVSPSPLNPMPFKPRTTMTTLKPLPLDNCFLVKDL
jgi:hypothetical protein